MRPRGPAISQSHRRRTKRPRSRAGEGGSPSSQRCVRKKSADQTRICTPQGEAVEGFACSQGRRRRSADGRSCAGERSHRSHAQGKDPGGDGHQEQDPGSGGAKARRVVHPAPSRKRSRLSAATPRSSPPIRNGRARRCCVGAQRRGCGSSASMRRRSAASPATGPPAPRASWRWRACCSQRAIGTARPGWRAMHGGSDELSERLEIDVLRDVPRPPQSR